MRAPFLLYRSERLLCDRAAVLSSSVLIFCSYRASYSFKAAILHNFRANFVLAPLLYALYALATFIWR